MLETFMKIYQNLVKNVTLYLNCLLCYRIYVNKDRQRVCK